MKQKTAMQDVVEKIKHAKDNFPAIGFHDEFVRGFNKAFDIAILIVEEVGFTKQREQIEEAGNTCGNMLIANEIQIMGDQSKTVGENYYKQKYGDEK